MNKKSFWIGALVGAVTLLAVEGAVIGGIKIIQSKEESKLSNLVFDEGNGDDVVEEASPGVFAENGNPIITDVEEKLKIEVIAPSGYLLDKDYESAYGAEFLNEGQNIRLAYSIENYSAEEMESYYEFEKEFFRTSKEISYSNVVTSDVQTIEVNGYEVNYISLSYTCDETENYIEYCAYVMIDDATEFMCNIYARAEDVNADIIKECFESQIPINR